LEPNPLTRGSLSRFFFCRQIRQDRSVSNKGERIDALEQVDPRQGNAWFEDLLTFGRSSCRATDAA
jgi:hypothetical protein